jgi:hypothetical protein
MDAKFICQTVGVALVYPLRIYLVVVSDQPDKIKEAMILLFCPCILPLRELRWRIGPLEKKRNNFPIHFQRQPF